MGVSMNRREFLGESAIGAGAILISANIGRAAEDILAATVGN